MPCFKIKVKWGKEVFQDVEVNTDEEPMVFKAQLFALTGVQPERQKVMLKGAILDQSWDKVKVKESVVVYHVPKSKGAAVDLNGMEGEVASRADDLNGTYISANLEIRVAFAVPDDPKGKTFIAHMKEDEVEAL